MAERAAWFFIYFWVAWLFIVLFFWFRLNWLNRKFNGVIPDHNRTLFKFWVWNIKKIES